MPRRCRAQPGVQRRTSAPRNADDVVGERLRQLHRAIVAAAVNDDDLSAAGTQRLKLPQRSCNNCRLVEDRHNDGQPTHEA